MKLVSNSNSIQTYLLFPSLSLGKNNAWTEKTICLCPSLAALKALLMLVISMIVTERSIPPSRTSYHQMTFLPCFSSQFISKSLRPRSLMRFGYFFHSSLIVHHRQCVCNHCRILRNFLQDDFQELEDIIIITTEDVWVIPHWHFTINTPW